MERIKIIIQHSGLSQKDFAKRLGISPNVITELFKGRSKGLSEKSLKAISREFRINLNWLLTGEGEMFLTPQSMGEDALGITNFEQLTSTKWFMNLPAEEKKIVTGLGIIRDREILKNISEIITCQVAKEKADRDLLDLKNSFKAKKK